MNGIGKMGQRGNGDWKSGNWKQAEVISLNAVAMTQKSLGSRVDSISNAASSGMEELVNEEECQPSNKRQTSIQPFLTINEVPKQIENNSSMISQVQNTSMLQSQLQVDMAQQINTYFEQCSGNINNFQEYRGRFVLPANHKLKKMIKNGEVLNYKEKDRMRVKRLEEQRRVVKMEKYEAIRRLKGIEQEEVELVKRTVKEQRNRSVQMRKIEYTPEENERVKMLVKNHRLFEKSLQEKTELYNHSVQAKRKEEQQVRKKQQQAENMEKKGQIAKKLKQINQRSQERKESLKNSVLKVQHQYIHKQLEKKYKSVQRLSKMQTQEKLKEISQRHRLNIDQINEHDRKYCEHLEKRSQSLSSIKLETTGSRKRQQGYFRKVIDQELFQLRQKNYQKLMKVKENEYKQKIMKYQQKVSKEFKPKIDPTLTIPVIPRTYSSVTLTNQERIEKGLEYLALAKEMRKNSEDITQPQKQVQKYGNKAYKDYLRERQPKNMDASQTQLKQIISKKHANDFTSIQRAKYLSQALQAKSKTSGDTLLFHSAKAKLSLLSQLY